MRHLRHTEDAAPDDLQRPLLESTFGLLERTKADYLQDIESDDTDLEEDFGERSITSDLLLHLTY